MLSALGLTKYCREALQTHVICSVLSLYCAFSFDIWLHSLLCADPWLLLLWLLIRGCCPYGSCSVVVCAVKCYVEFWIDRAKTPRTSSCPCTRCGRGSLRYSPPMPRLHVCIHTAHTYIQHIHTAHTYSTYIYTDVYSHVYICTYAVVCSVVLHCTVVRCPHQNMIDSILSLSPDGTWTAVPFLAEKVLPMHIVHAIQLVAKRVRTGAGRE